MRSKYGFLVILVFIASLLTACGPDDSPEKQVRLYIKSGEEAAETRNLGDLKKLIAENYQDDHRRTRRDIVALAARYFLTNKNIHVFSRIGEMSFLDSGKAKLVLYVAMTGQNVSDLDSLLNMQAELYLFDMHLALNGKKWQLMSADWRPANPEDFF